MAGKYLSRIIVFQKRGEDFYCILPFTTLAGSEVTVGILVACVPTLMPIFHPERFERRAVARRQRGVSCQYPLAADDRQPSHNLLPVSDPTPANRRSSRIEKP